MKTLVIAFLCLLAAGVRADTFDDSEAQRRGVSVEKIQLERAQARISELEKQLADAKSPAAPTTAPATQLAKTALFADIVKTVPPALRKKSGESQRQADERESWLVSHFTGKRIVAKLKVSEVLQDKIQLSTDHEEYRIICQVDPESFGHKIYVGDTITLEGSISKITGAKYAGVSPDEVYLDDCKITGLAKSK